MKCPRCGRFMTYLYTLQDGFIWYCLGCPKAKKPLRDDKK